MGHTFLSVLRVFSLNMLLYCGFSQDAMLTIEPNWSTLFTGESVTFLCDMREGADSDWYYKLFIDGREYSPFSTDKSFTLQHLTTDFSAQFQCIGYLKAPVYYTKKSNTVFLTVSESNVILEHPASLLYQEEWVTLRCRHRYLSDLRNASFYRDGSLIKMDIKPPTAGITVQLLSGGSSYTCKFNTGQESEPVTVKVESHRPKALLRKDKPHFPVRGNVTLTCSVISPSSGWKYFWYRANKSPEALTVRDVIFLSGEKIMVSQGGLYWCRGGRGNPVYYTEYSDAIVTNRAVVTLEPSWPEIYHGDTITLRCDIEDGKDIDWEYNWLIPNSNTPQTQIERKIKKASQSDSGDYRCMGTVKGSTAVTDWSNALTLTLSNNAPVPVLAVSPSWLSSGDSVTLNCSIKNPAAGWKFYWYKHVPPRGTEILPGSRNGTKEDSYTVHGQTQTAGYMCRAGRGNPVYYTRHSELNFVWSGDDRSAASITVRPDRVQHFIGDTVTLTCEGNSTKWQVNKFNKYGFMFPCPYWGTMTGSICNINMVQNSDGVYWCESESGQFSNAVNITGPRYDVILVSPVHPVAEGDSVTLSCKLKTGNLLSQVDFYKNGNKIIQNDTRGELFISAVSKLDEGFYKCEGRDSQHGPLIWKSPESWMSVKASRPQHSSFPVLLIVGVVCGSLLIFLLLMFLYYSAKSKESCFIRSPRTNQGSAKNHMINQDETECGYYASVLNDDVCLSESIKGPEEAGNGGYSDITYSLIEFKNVAKKKNGSHIGPEENAVYSNVKIGLATGKSSPVEADETVYSEVRAGTALLNNAVIT